MPIQFGQDLSLALVLKAQNLMGKGTVAAEKDINKLSNTAKKSAKDIETAYHNLGIRSEREIRREVQKMQASYKRLQATGTLSAKDQKRAFDQLQRKLKELRREAKGATSDIQGIGALLPGAGLAAAVYAIAGSIKAINQAGLEMERIELTMKSVTGSTRAAGVEFDFVSREADRLGLNLQKTAQSYAQVMAAARGTKLEGQGARDVFVAISEASAVLGLSAADSEGILRALNQMISKGTVQAEELRGQLGERLPGAFNIAAKAMGVSTAELGKMLEQGKVLAEDFIPKFAAEVKKTYGKDVPAAAESARASFERMHNSIFNIKTMLAKSGIMESSSAFGETVAGWSEDIVSGLLAMTKTGAISAAHFVQSIGATKEEQERLAKVFEKSYREIRKEYGYVKKDLDALGPSVKVLGDRLNDSLQRPAKSAKELREELTKIGQGAEKALSPALKSLADLSKAMESQYSKNKSLREKVFNATGGAAAGHFNDQINAMKAEAKAMLGAQIAESDVAAYIEQQLATLQQSMQKAGANIQAGYIGGMDAGGFVAQLAADLQHSSTAMSTFKLKTSELATELSKAGASYSKMLKPEVAQEFMAQIDAMRESLVAMSSDANIEAQFDTLQALTEINRIQTELANIPREIVTYHKIITQRDAADVPAPPVAGTRATGGSIPADGLYYMHAGEKVQSNSTTYGDFNFNFPPGQMSPGEARSFVRDVVIPELKAAAR